MVLEHNKRGLAIIYDPHNLQQFVWYFFTYSKNVMWDALCLPNGYKGSYMGTYCAKTEIFHDIMTGYTDYNTLSLYKRFLLFCKMLWSCIRRKKIQCVKEILNQYVGDIDKYDEIVCLCDTGFISGLCALLSNEKKISYLDDGLGDYHARTKWSSTFKKTSFMYWQSLVLNRLGFGCKGRIYFEPTKYCYKYCSVPGEMHYRNYKEILPINMDVTNSEGYSLCLQKTYKELDLINFKEIDAVFFTDNLKVFSSNYQKYYDLCTSFVSKECKTVLLKRHPRDDANYKFSDNIKVINIDDSIPAEVILPYLTGKKIYFTMFSSIIIFMHQYNYNYNIFFADWFYRDNLNDKKATWLFHSRDKVVELCDRFSRNNYKLLEI